MSKTPEQWVKKYSERTSVAGEAYKEGVQNPKRGPATAAIAARAVWVRKMAEKSTQDKWEGGLRKVGDNGVIEAAVTKGADRYVPGVQASINKVQEFAAAFAPHLAEGQRKIQAMPKGTLADSKARASAMIDHNAKFRFKK